MMQDNIYAQIKLHCTIFFGNYLSQKTIRGGGLSLMLFSQENTNKSTLLNCIKNSPGIRYRELIKATGLSNGVIEYHLKKLEKSRQVKVRRYPNKTTRYYYLLNISVKESRIIDFIRRPTDRKIVLFLLQHNFRKFMDIQRKVKKAFSTVSWHLSRLKQAGIVSISNHGYRLKNRTIVKHDKED